MASLEFISAIIVFALAGICAFMSVCHFMEKGFLINNAYIWASKAEREKMDKKPHYRQTAIVFCLLCTVFLVLGMSIVFQNEKLELVEIPLIIGTLIYAIASSVIIEKRTKR